MLVIVFSRVSFQHDSTVAAALTALEVFNGEMPPYAACVILELHENPTGHFFVNVIYKNVTDSEETHKLVFPGKAQVTASLKIFIRTGL